ncbi:MAG: TRAP transporter large permease subunit [Castellaniella sp.]
MRKEVWVGLGIMFAVLVLLFFMMPPLDKITDGHVGLLMLGLIVVSIMMGFPTAFTLMGMGVTFTLYAYRSMGWDVAWDTMLDLMVLRTYAVMTNDVLIAVPLFIFMGYLVERANLIERLFHTLHLVAARVPGSLAVASIVTCAIFATATGIVGAVVTLMGLLAFPAMLNAGYSVRLSAGVITAGGCLGILIPPSIMLIVYGAVAGVSVVKLYAGAFFPGVLLSGLYILYILIITKLRPSMAPPLPQEERTLPLTAASEHIARTFSSNALVGLTRALGSRDSKVSRVHVHKNLLIALVPALALVLTLGMTYEVATAPDAADDPALLQMGLDSGADDFSALFATLDDGDAEDTAAAVDEAEEEGVEAPASKDVPTWFWVFAGVSILLMIGFYAIFNFQRLELFKLMTTSFFPLAGLILAVLGSIVFGFATPSEAAAMGAFGGLVLGIAYRRFSIPMLRESVNLAAKTTAMVCWLFIGASMFAAAFSLLGGQAIVNDWVIGLELSPVQFMIMAQLIIFFLGWPLEWTEIIIIFMPIFIPLVDHYGVDPLFFGLLVALNLQTSFLTPPMAMSAFYLKGVAPPHVSLVQIFMGALPFVGIVFISIVLMYVFPGIGLWLPNKLY